MTVPLRQAMVKEMDLISSLNQPHQIQAFGFKQADEAAHMIAWLGRGVDFRQFVTQDVETEIYTQTPRSQLLSITCQGDLQLKTKVMSPEAVPNSIAKGISITFPLSLRIKMSDDAIWKLDVELNYEADNLHLPDQRTLIQNFTIVGHEQISSSET